MLKRFKSILFLSILCIASILAMVIFSFGQATAFASSGVSPTFFAPFGDAEYFPIENPKDFYFDSEIFAVLQDDKKIVVKENGKDFRTIDYSKGTSLSQITVLNDKCLLISDNGAIFKINLEDDSSSRWDFNINQADDHVGGNYFAIYQNQLISVYNSQATRYTFDDNYEVISKEINLFDVNGNMPIATNKNGDIFYVYGANNTIAMRKGDAITKSEDLVSGVTPTKMIANENYVFYISGTSIYMLNINGETHTAVELSTAKDTGFDIGEIKSPTGLCFNGQNLLVADSTNNTIAEFKIEDGSLVFTGFAIGKGASAYNRIGLTAKKVSNYDNKVAVLDNKKLTIFNSNVADYSQENYQNYILPTDANHENYIQPDIVTLGKKSALLVEKNGYEVQLIDISAKSPTFVLKKSLSEGNFTQEIADACYLNGKYYVLKINTVQQSDVRAVLIVIDENAPESEAIFITLDKNSLFTTSTKMNVDVFSNVYLTAKDGKIYEFTKDGEIYSPATATNYTYESELIELDSDLGGTLYCVYPDKVTYCFGGKTETIEIKPNVLGTAKNIKSLSMNFDEKTVYVIPEGEGVLLKTQSLNNLSASNVSVPDSFITTSSSADVSKLKFFSIREGALSYEIEKGSDGKFVYNQVINFSQSEDFVFVCSIPLSPFANENINTEFYILAGKFNTQDSNGKQIKKDVLVLVNSLDTIDSDVAVLDSAINDAFVTTEVSAYHFPILTKNADYALTYGENKIKLDADTHIYITKEFEFLDKAFYFAHFIKDGETFYGYIPKSFTVETPFSMIEPENFRIERVKKTDVYTEIGLINKVFSLEEGTEIRLYSTKDGVAYIGYEVNGTYLKGFIEAQNVINAPNTVIRNVLIVLCVMVAVCATSIYFIVKKR